MPIELTDVDHKEIDRLRGLDRYHHPLKDDDDERILIHAIYLAGMRAGLERAAVRCDGYVPVRTYASANADHYRGFRDGAMCCAAAIRSIIADAS